MYGMIKFGLLEKLQFGTQINISQVEIPDPTVEDPNPTQDYSVFFSDWTFTELDLNLVVHDESNSPIIKKLLP